MPPTDDEIEAGAREIYRHWWSDKGAFMPIDYEATMCSYREQAKFILIAAERVRANANQNGEE